MQLRACFIIFFLNWFICVQGQVDSIQEQRFRKEINFLISNLIKDSAHIETSYAVLQIEVNPQNNTVNTIVLEQSLKFPKSVLSVLLDSIQRIIFENQNQQKVIIPIFIINNFSVDKEISSLVKILSLFFSSKHVKAIFYPAGISIIDSIIVTIQPREID